MVATIPMAPTTTRVEPNLEISGIPGKELNARPRISNIKDAIKPWLVLNISFNCMAYTFNYCVSNTLITPQKMLSVVKLYFEIL